MYQLIYTSLASHRFSDEELEKLLVRARIRNAAQGVTGMLVFHDGVFLQALEGEKSDVLETYDRIRVDPRHRSFEVLHRGPGPEQRAFGEWSMGFSGDSAASILKGFVRVGNALDLRGLEAPRATELLRLYAA